MDATVYKTIQLGVSFLHQNLFVYTWSYMFAMLSMQSFVMQLINYPSIYNILKGYSDTFFPNAILDYTSYI